MHRLIRTFCVLAGSMGVLLGAVSIGSGAASRLAVRQLPAVVHGASGGTSSILVRVRSVPAATCRATVSVKRARQTLPAAAADRRGHVGWRWLILPTSPSGTWRITTSCRSGRAGGTASRGVSVVTRSRRAIGSVGDPTSLTISEGTTLGLATGACGPFTPGQACLAYRKRRDVYDIAVANGVPRGGTRRPGRGFSVWDGGQWLVNARRAGLPTGSHPAAGALVVWGVPNGASIGRVAYVVQATSDTYVLVTECNFDWSARCRTIWKNPQAVANLQGYIHTQSVGSGTPISIQGSAAPVNTAAPTGVGTPAVGSVLTATDGGWKGSGAIRFAYQWQSSADGTSGWTGAPGSGATTSSYTVAVADAGRYLRVVVTASTAGGSAAVGSAARAVIPYNTVPPKVSGSLVVGNTLTTTTGTWLSATIPTYAYQWQVSTDGMTGWAPIVGAVASAYTIAGGNVNKHLRVQVTSTNAGGSAIPVIAAVPGTVKAAPPPGKLVAQWHMDENSGSSMFDAVGGHTGTFTGVSFDLQGLLGTAYVLNGSSSFITVPDTADLNAGDLPITIKISLKTNALPNASLTQDWDLIRKGTFAADPGEFKVEYQPTGQASCGFKGLTGYSELQQGPALNNGSWHTVQCVKTATDISLVVDGVKYGPQAATLGSISNTAPILIGAHSPGSEVFNGSLDEASIAIG